MLGTSNFGTWNGHWIHNAKPTWNLHMIASNSAKYIKILRWKTAWYQKIGRPNSPWQVQSCNFLKCLWLTCRSQNSPRVSRFSKRCNSFSFLSSSSASSSASSSSSAFSSFYSYFFSFPPGVLLLQLVVTVGFICCEPFRKLRDAVEHAWTRTLSWAAGHTWARTHAGENARQNVRICQLEWYRMVKKSGRSNIRTYLRLHARKNGRKNVRIEWECQNICRNECPKRCEIECQ